MSKLKEVQKAIIQKNSSQAANMNCSHKTAVLTYLFGR